MGRRVGGVAVLLAAGSPALVACSVLAACSVLPGGAAPPAAHRQAPPAATVAAPPAARTASAVPAALDVPGTAWPPPEPRFPARDRVGAVFGPALGARHYCTGSVVDSPHRDLVITAAHCVHGGSGGGYRTGLAFSPGLRMGGVEPAGRWRVRAALAAPGWVASSDPAADVAFLVVEPLRGERVQDVAGGNPIAFAETDGGPVQLIGYPGASDVPVVCDGLARRSGPAQLRVRCPGFTGGTSGSPWLSAPGGGPRTTGDGVVVGVIGGYQAGGWTADVSYSSRFGAGVGALYRLAVRMS